MKKFAIVCLIGIIIVLSLITYFHLSRIKPDCNKAIYEHINYTIRVLEYQKNHCKDLSKGSKYKYELCSSYPVTLEKVYKIYNDSLSSILPPEKCNPTKLAAAGIISMENAAIVNYRIFGKLVRANFSERYMKEVLSLKLEPELKIEEIKSKVSCQKFLDLLRKEMKSQIFKDEAIQIISKHGIINTKTCEDAAQIVQIFHKNLKESLEREDLDNVTKYTLITLGKAIEKCGYWFNKEECLAR